MKYSFKITIVLFSMFLFSCENIEFVDKMKREVEKAYFEGQKDAINGDIRIEKNEDSVYVWTKSPWDDNCKPIFVPTKEDSKNSNE
jgi:hypothetical protein